jgi:hypothetical protein
MGNTQFAPQAVGWLKMYHFFDIIKNPAVFEDDALLASVFGVFRSLLLSTFVELPDDIFLLIEWEVADRKAVQKMALEFLTTLSRFRKYAHLIKKLDVRDRFKKIIDDELASRAIIRAGNASPLSFVEMIEANLGVVQKPPQATESFDMEKSMWKSGFKKR